MTPAQVGELLTVIAEFDGRQVTRETVMAWHSLLADVDANAAVKAVREHYSTQSRRIMPADIKRAAAPRPREQWLV